MVQPIQRVNVDVTASILEELDKAARDLNVSRKGRHQDAGPAGSRSTLPGTTRKSAAAGALTAASAEGTAMDVTLPADLRKQIEQKLASGCFQGPDDLIEQAVRHFLNQRQRGQRRLDALRRIGQAVDRAGLYERVLVPGQE